MSRLSDLNPRQLEAVHHTEGPLLILAGAGSGKTRVIVHRIAHLIQDKKISPHQILAVTFTNKAAGEMKERLQAMVPGSLGALWVSTFHAASVRILRDNSERLGYRRSFVIYDDTDQKSLLKKCFEELHLDPRHFKPSAVLGRIQGAKNHLLTPEAYRETVQDAFEQKIATLYELYQQRLRENQAFDFGDLLMETVFLFQKNPRLLQHYQERFRYIMIDEYQDTNVAQYHWVRLLAGQHQNLCVVGDDDQSVYRWRGADLQNILNFEKDYSGTHVIKLEQNYRSTGSILKIAAAVIRHNQGRKPKELWTENDAGEGATWYIATDDRQEAVFITETMREWQAGGAPFSEMAIFYRTNAQSRLFEDELRKRQIPYVIYGGMRFYDRKEIRDTLAYLRLSLNSSDEVAFRRIFNVPTRGLGPKALSTVELKAKELGESLRAGLAALSDDPTLSTAMQSKLAAFHKLLQRLEELAAEVNVGSLVQAILDESGYRKELEQQQTLEAEDRLENLEEFLSVVGEYERSEPEPTLAGFLEQVSLTGGADQEDPTTGAVRMMTLHLAKGLEFDHVCIAGMEEGIFPHARSLDETEELEEERRLCYVGITRARQRLLLSSAIRRRLYGGDQMNPPSRFLEEVPKELLHVEGHTEFDVESHDVGDDVQDQDYDAGPHYDDDFDQRSADERGGLAIGMQVQHPHFGIGVVRRKQGEGEQQKVTVFFQDGRMKTLLLRYANLHIVG